MRARHNVLRIACASGCISVMTLSCGVCSSNAFCCVLFVVLCLLCCCILLCLLFRCRVSVWMWPLV
jgi:hypothetical protein